MIDSDIESKSRHSGQSTPAYAYERLKCLYEISKHLVQFESAEKTVPKILSVVAGTFPLLSAVLVEKIDGEIVTTVWQTPGMSESQQKAIVENARSSFAYFMTTSPVDLQAQPVTRKSIPLEHGTRMSERPQGDDLVIVPLVVNREPTFGVLQIEGSRPLGEDEVRFAGALGNMIAVALDRHNKARAERVSREKHSDEMVSARDAAQSASQTKSNFLANMSHEIRTPLNAIMGFAELLKDPQLSRTDKIEFLSVIIRNSGHLLRIIDDILDLAKVEAGKIVVEKIQFSFPDLLTDFRALMSHRARANGIEFVLRAETLIPECVVSDPTRIRQILSNVVGNAIKFSERGKVELTVLFHEPDLVFRVKDTGRGISRDQQETLFRAFMQADSSTTRRFGGTGLGLVLTKKMCEVLGGDFALLESEIGKGSTFEGHIKVAVPSTTRLVSVESIAVVPRPAPNGEGLGVDLRGHDILLVEDSVDNQTLIMRMLSKTGARIDLASNGREGVEKALGHRYSAILMDIQMPEMDGHEATRVLRSKGISGPIIAITAHAMKEEREAAIKSGFSHFLSKPVRKKNLFDLLVSLEPILSM
jgi:signal transduction histidine kinase